MSEQALLNFKDQLAQAAKELDLFDWAQKYVFLRGKKFNFKKHPELEDIYRDLHHTQVFLKSTQVGISTYAINKMLWLSIRQAMKTMYCGPDDGWIAKFSKDRVKKLIEGSPGIKKKIGVTNTTEQKDLGFSTIYLTGLVSESGVTSVDGDLLIVDETDLVSQENKVVAQDRLDHSELAWFMQMSKPSIPDFGIHESFQEGDQHYRLFHCTKCNADNNVVENIEQEPLEVLRVRERKGDDFYYFACEKCGAPLDPKNARWVPKFPGRDVRSYHVSQAYWTWQLPRYQNTAHKLYAAFVAANTMALKKRFWRALLGLPFAGDEQPLNDSIFNRWAGAHGFSPSFAGRSFMGVDQGEKLHVSILHPSGYRYLYHYFAELDDFEELDPLMKKHNVRFCIIDYKPNTHEAKKFAIRHKNRVAVQDFQGDDMIQEKITKKGREEIRKLNMPRTDVLDDFVEHLVGGVAVLPGLGAHPIIKEVRKQLKKLIRIKATDAKGREVYKYKAKVSNHFGMSSMLALQALYAVQNRAVVGSGIGPVGGRFRRKNESIH